MDAEPGNPDTNELRAGITEKHVAEAVSRSGYPLQTLVAEGLLSTFEFVYQEWNYVDTDAGKTRAMDIWARRILDEYRSSQVDARVHVALCALVECKKSDLPYVFFLSANPIPALDFPLLCGLPNLELRKADGTSAPSHRVGEALDLGSLPFATEPEFCSSFSKVNRLGKDKVELSGEEPFRALVSPLVKAMQHHERNMAPTRHAYVSYLCDITVGIGVLDAPMVGVRVSETGDKLTYVPWVRVARHESGHRENDDRSTSRLLAIDVVHKDYLQTYLGKLLNFAVDTATRVEQFQDDLDSVRFRLS